MMKRFQSRLSAGVLSGLLLAWGLAGAPVWAQAQQPPVEFDDDDLYAAVADALNIQPGIPLFPQDVAGVETLRARDADIDNLTGLEYAENLRELDLRDNDISDLRPLAELEQLEWLSVRENQKIEDLSPLAGLTGLRYLNINRNENIQSILPLADMTGLEVLIMRNVPVLNDVQERAVLQGLSELERLNARNTGLSSVQVLLPGLENGLYTRQLDLRDNPLGNAELLRSFADDGGGELEIEYDRDALLYDPAFLHYFTLRVQREVFAQNFLNDAGVMTSRAGLAHISFEIVQDDGSVEELDYGMYMSFEPVNKSFIDHRWGSDYNDSHLYKNLWQSGGPAPLAPDHRLSQDGSRLIGAKDWERNYQPSYDQKNDDPGGDLGDDPGGAPGSGRSHEQLRAFIAELDERSGPELRDYLDEEFAIERYLRFMAGNLLLGMPDDYRGNFNNYYMYFPEDDSPIEFIPYDYDHGLGGGRTGRTDGAASPGRQAAGDSGLPC